MLRNYFLIAFRNLLKSKGFSLINILGLAMGLTCCLLMLMYVWDELSYDRFHEKAERIYRVNSDVHFGGEEMSLAVVSDAAGPSILKDYPQVEKMVRFRQRGSFQVKKGDQNLTEEDVSYVDSSVFEVFSFELIAGNPQTALRDPQTLVLTESAAKKYFDRTDVLGESLVLNDDQVYRVTGVMRDFPHNSHIRSRMFLSMASYEESRANNWLSNNFNTYLLLKDAKDAQWLDSQMDVVLQNYAGPQIKAILNQSLDEFRASGSTLLMSLMPMSDIHLRSQRIAEMSPNGSIQYVYLFSAVALFVLLIACVNFMNLSTARSAGRAREVGIRKVLGSAKGSLIGQFLAESVLLSLIALALSLVASRLLLPWFNEVSGKEMPFFILSNPWFLVILLGLVILTGLMAGSYPAFFLSSFQPIAVLRGKLAKGGGGFLRSALVVFQFTASIVLIAGTMVVYRQMNFIRSKELGFNKERVLLVKNVNALGSRIEAFKESSLRMSGVSAATSTEFLPVSSARSNTALFPSPAVRQEEAVLTQFWEVDHDYVPTMGMNLVKGRNFSREFLSDSQAVVINESAVRMFNLGDAPVGKQIYTFINDQGQELIPMNVVGVVKDFHFESLRDAIGPVVMQLGQSGGYVCLRLSSEDLPATLAAVENEWNQMNTGQPFSYQFMDDAFDAMYRSEQRMGQILAAFALFAIFVASLGLLGLVSYTTEQRTKEIGIRKVLGASLGQITGLLSKDFFVLVLIAIVIATPIAWAAMNWWLQDFSYRTDISIGLFVIAGLGAIGVTLLTVSLQAVRAALANPVNSLKD
ncbi:MAG: FtsX-like permease family protein [Bacteroidetes bacterium]|nr:MAG: FtsX-like permease family protein [Bacteroidota bacterium]